MTDLPDQPDLPERDEPEVDGPDPVEPDQPAAPDEPVEPAESVEPVADPVDEPDGPVVDDEADPAADEVVVDEDAVDEDAVDEDAVDGHEDVEPALSVGDITHGAGAPMAAGATLGDEGADAHDLDGHDVGDEGPSGPPPWLVLIGVLVVLAAIIGGGILLASGGGDEAVYTIDGEAQGAEAVAERLSALSQDDLGSVVRDPEAADAAQRQTLAQFLSTLIADDLLTLEADARGLELAEGAVAEELDAVLEEVFGGDQEAFDAAIGQSGLTDAGVESQLRTTLLIELLAEDELGGVEVGDEEVEAVYEAQYSAGDVSHILVPTEEEAADALARLEDGEDFAAVATELSQDPGSAAQGGLLGPFVPGQFVEEFETAVLETEPGEVTGPVETQFGFHLITVSEPPALEDVREEITTILRDQALGAAVGTIFTLLDEDHEVTVGEAYGTWTGLQASGVVPPAEEPASLQVTPTEGG